MTNYRKGARFEYRVRDLLRKHGYVAERKAGSAPYDIIAFKNGRVRFLIDAKKTSQDGKDYIHVSKDDLEKILLEASKVGATPLIAWGFSRTPVYAEGAEKLIAKLEGKHIRLEKGSLLKDIISRHPAA